MTGFAFEAEKMIPDFCCRLPIKIPNQFEEAR